MLLHSRQLNKGMRGVFLDLTSPEDGVEVFIILWLAGLLEFSLFVVTCFGSSKQRRPRDLDGKHSVLSHGEIDLVKKDSIALDKQRKFLHLNQEGISQLCLC